MASRYWVGGTGTWDASSTTNWASSSGGAAGASAPVAADSVFFDANSGSGTVSTSGNLAVNYVTVNSASITLSLGGNLTVTNVFTLTTGSVALNDKIITALAIQSIGSTSTRSITVTTGKAVCTGNSANVWIFDNATNLTCSTDLTVEFTYAGSTGTRSIVHGDTGATESNTPSFSITAGSDTISLRYARNVNFTGFSGTLNSRARLIYGDLTLSSGMTMTAGANTITFASTNATPRVITTNGKTVNAPITFNGAGGTWQLGDDLTVNASYAVTLTNGTFNAANRNVSLGTFALGSGTKTLTLGSGTWSVSGSGTCWDANTNVTNLTVSASTATINMTSSSAKTFAGGAKTWPTLNQGGSGALTIQQSNTFANITNTVQSATVTLTAGTTQTVSAFSLSGTAGNLITLNSSSAGSQATLSDSSGTNSVSYVSIKDINATGGATWNAFSSSGNVDAGNNVGWDFNDLAFRYIYTRRKNKVIFPF